jgi:hypothetical protein
MSHRGIARALQTGAALTLATLVALTLWAALGSLGDAAGAAVARGVTWGLGIAWTVNLVGLVVLLALAELSASRPPGDERQRSAPSEL